MKWRQRTKRNTMNTKTRTLKRPKLKNQTGSNKARKRREPRFWLTQRRACLTRWRRLRRMSNQNLLLLLPKLKTTRLKSHCSRLKNSSTNNKNNNRLLLTSSIRPCKKKKNFKRSKNKRSSRDWCKLNLTRSKWKSNNLRLSWRLRLLKTRKKRHL